MPRFISLLELCFGSVSHAIQTPALVALPNLLFLMMNPWGGIRGLGVVVDPLRGGPVSVEKM